MLYEEGNNMKSRSIGTERSKLWKRALEDCHQCRTPVLRYTNYEAYTVEECHLYTNYMAFTVQHSKANNVADTVTPTVYCLVPRTVLEKSREEPCRQWWRVPLPLYKEEPGFRGETHNIGAQHQKSSIQSREFIGDLAAQ